MERNYFDHFEGRICASTSLAGVGAFYGGSLIPYTVEATISDDGDVTGSRRDATHSGASSPQTLSVESVEFLPGGRYRPTFRSSFTPYSRVGGAQFFSGGAHQAGWFSGLDSGYSRAEFAMLVERSGSLAQSDLSGQWASTSIAVTETEAFGTWGSLNVSGSSVARVTNRAGQDPLSDTLSISSVQSNGAIRLSGGIYAWASSSEHIVVAADLDGSNGDAGFSVVFREHSGRTMRQVAGAYRVGIVATGRLANEVSGKPLALVETYLDLRPDGTFAQYELAAYDAGDRTPDQTGSWSLNGSVITVFESGGAKWQYAVTPDQSVIVPRFHTSVSSNNDVLCGMATRVESPLRHVFTVAGREDNDAARVYSLGEDDQWRGVDLVSVAGGPAVTGNVVAWTDPVDGLQYAAAQAGSSLSLYRLDRNGAWSRRDLRATTEGAVAISSSLDVLVGSDGRVYLTGLSAAGDLLMYTRSDGVDITGQPTWTFSNIAEELPANGFAMPDLREETVNYATSWGGLNVAGLDAEGNIWSIWWAPGASHWSASNLTSTYGAEPVAGGLAVYLTPWEGINIAALDDTGEVVVTWWVPSFGGTWNHSNLSDDADGPALRAESVSSYVSSWGGLNIVGLDRDTGQVRVYWWSPERTADGWAVTNLSDTVGSDAPRLTDDLRGLAGGDGSLNVFGTTQSDADVRYYWEPSFGGNWETQDLSAEAISY